MTKEKIVEEKVEETKVEKKPKKVVIVLLICIVSILVLGVIGMVIYHNFIKPDTPKPVVLEPLPKPEVDPTRGDFGIDKNINIDTIDKYLGRSDTVYRDMRMLEDPATYENLGGNRFLNGYIKGFEVIPLPYIIPVNGLPVEVGQTYDGITLFYEQDNRYVANYEESMEILEKYFPKDKNIFLMCGGGGYAAMMKNFLIVMGWDANKIYNIGGHWYYKGENNIDLTMDNGSYDFDSVPYINIDFNSLTKSALYKDAGVKATGIILNPDKVTIEEKLTYRLDGYVLPNQASNREMIWSSSDEKIVTVSDNGLVKGIKAGTATVTVTSKDGGFTASSVITVTKRDENKITLDDVSKENKDISNIDVNSVFKKYETLIYNEDGSVKDYYKDYENYKAAIKQRDTELVPMLKERAKIIDKLMEDKKSFVLFFYNDSCGSSPYNIAENAPELFDKYGLPYINISENVYTYDGYNIYYYSDFIDYSYSNNSVLVIKEGKIISNLNVDVTYINDESDFKNWISKYVDFE